MSDLSLFFKDKRILVTGHTGFKGSWLSQVLYEWGAKVYGVSLKPKLEKNHFSLLELDKSVESIYGDIRDFQFLEKTVLEIKPTIVFHLAAQSLVRESYVDPLGTYSTNVIGSANLLMSILKCDSVESLVYITSDKCYENVEWEWGYRESDRLGGVDPYSSSKACAEILFSSFMRSLFRDRVNFGAASARAGNVIGGGDWSKNRLIPDAVRAAESNMALEIRQPGSTRPWQHVLDPINGYLMLARNLTLNSAKFSGAWNFGPTNQNTKSVGEVTDIFLKLLTNGRVGYGIMQDKLTESNLLQLNCDRATSILNWQPKWNIETTLNKTADWYKAIWEGTSAKQITSLQIKEFFGGQID